jgi:two-component system phosphate regulon sensor histidine kinase PhoR
LVALTGIVEQAIEETRLAAPKRVIRLEQTEKGQPLMVRGDEGRLLQALNNLLNNAIKHAPQSDRIDVRLGRANTDSGAAHAQIEVRDYGPGIAPENLGRIFNRFNQVSADGRQPKGLGLGLYIAKGIIEQHGGAIAVKSKLGEGSAFTISLPLTNEDVEKGDTS